MISQDLLEILVCPETRQPVEIISPEKLVQINQEIKSGNVKNAGGGVVEGELSGALLRKDRRIAYPVRGGIPIMLVGEGFYCDIFAQLD